MDRAVVDAGKSAETARVNHFIDLGDLYGRSDFCGGTMNQIRPIAICVFLRKNKILVSEGYDPVKVETFYRPLGGGIEFGENSKETICREIMEEVNVEVDQESLRYLGAVENIFMFNGSPGHEIVLVYDGALKESGLYEQAVILGKEVNGEDIHAVWKDLEEFITGKSILYPTDLVEMLVTKAPRAIEGESWDY
jgi:8-oxo-dGTP pyrophosphatase MutT (NUDIX family)